MADMIMLLFICGLLLAPAVLLVIGRRKQKQRRLSSFDPGLGPWNANPDSRVGTLHVDHYPTDDRSAGPDPTTNR